MNRSNEEWALRLPDGLIAGARQTDSVRVLLDREVANGAKTMRRNLLRASAYAAARRYRFQNGPETLKSEDPSAAVGRTLERVRAEHAAAKARRPRLLGAR